MRPLPPRLAKPRRPLAPTRLGLEWLEDRDTPTAYFVSSFADDGSAGTLRSVLTQANADGAAAGADTITFTADGTVTLSLGELPITRTAGDVTIDGGGHAVTVSGNHASRVFNVGSGVTATLTGLTITQGSASQAGGVMNQGLLAVMNSTVSGNTATTFGGGVYNDSGTLNVTNSTVSGNSGSGGGVYNDSGTLNVTNSTVSGNSGTGGISGSGGALTLTNSIVANNGGGDLFLAGITTAGSHDVIGDGTGVGSTFTASFSGDPLLAPLGNYGGPTQTTPLLPGSPAIDAGAAAGAPAADQRGLSRVGAVDIGSTESQGYTLAPVAGSTPQAAVGGAAFTNPLAVIVTPNNPNDPVNGGLVTYTAPGAGATAALSGGSAAISGGQAAVTATANGTRGGYTVTAAAAGAATPVDFSLTNVLQPMFTSLGSDSIGYGTATEVLTGTLAAGATPATGGVTVTISGNGITPLVQSASLNGSGGFSASFSTGALPVGATPYTVTYSYSAQDDFLAASDGTTTLAVTPRAITVTANSGQGKVYGNVDPTLTYTVGGSGLVNGDTLPGALSRAAGENVGPYAVTQGSLNGGGNYTLTFTP
ncbi:MAG TPA: choice-of-anchor Q domain-containing protein [Urbifossiella sp.]|nr:choice-of-anchor Q domain-containing protein [Urbifossiella sp.]